MLICKYICILLIMDDTVPPLVRGKMTDSSEICISDKEMIHELDLKGYGDAKDGKLFLAPFEALYLLHTGRLILHRGRKQIDFDLFVGDCQRDDPDILTRFLIYRDLRNRGYVVKDGFGFGIDFRVYERGHFGEKGAKFLVFGLNEGMQEKMGVLQKKIEEITQMGKEPIMAVIERRGEVIYYKINKMTFYENTCRLKEPVFHA